MKTKFFLVVAVMLGLSSLIFAQKAGLAFQTGSNVINAGVGFAGIKWKGVNYGVSYEYGVNDDIGVGGHVGYSQYSKNGYTYTAVMVGAKGSYHFLTTDKMDPYAGAELGYVDITHTGHNEASSPESFSAVGVGLYGGVRYYLSPGTAVYGELKLSAFAVIGVGVSFKF